MSNTGISRTASAEVYFIKELVSGMITVDDSGLTFGQKCLGEDFSMATPQIRRKGNERSSNAARLSSSPDL